MKEGMQLLGLKVQDVVTGCCGVVTSVSFDLYGCVQVLVHPGLVEGKIVDQHWFDVKRLTIIKNTPVMAVPNFADIPGGQALPQYQSQP
jgi:hypothetical protein